MQLSPRQDLLFLHFLAQNLSCNPVVDTLQVQAGRRRKICRACVRSVEGRDLLAVARTLNKRSGPNRDGSCLSGVSVARYTLALLESR